MYSPGKNRREYISAERIVASVLVQGFLSVISAASVSLRWIKRSNTFTAEARRTQRGAQSISNSQQYRIVASAL